MPTVILLDTSSEMSCRTELSAENGRTKFEVAVSGINTFLDYISTYARLEFVALATFATHFEVVCPFTRDYSKIREKLEQLEPFDIPFLNTGLHGVEKLVTSEWGSGTHCYVLLVSQENINLALEYQLSFSFPGVLLGVFMSVSRLYIEKTFEHIEYDYKLYLIDRYPQFSNIEKLFYQVAQEHYSTWAGQLICGNFCSRVALYPPPLPYTKATDFDYCVHTMENVLEICGFIELQHLGSPAAVSRHLVLPVTNIVCPHLTSDPTFQPVVGTEEDMINEEIATTPSFCVLLHGALKVENMAALCSIGNDWYGVLFSWADSKKKSNLMLSVLEPGSDSIPWLGDLNSLMIPSSSQAGESFPVKPAEKRSYSQNCIAWIRQPGLQSDIQKILRHARKIPDKTQQFYKELNRVRRAAICLGFMSLIECIADILERECTLLPGTAHPACAFQLTHAAGVLREPYSKDTKYNIMPMKMSFN